MINQLFVTTVLILTAITAAGQADASDVSGTAQELTVPQMQADFDLMRHVLEEAHPGLYRYSTKAQMDHNFDALRAKLSRPMAKAQFQVVVTETLASIRCGHTRMHWDPEKETAMRDAPTFPLRVVFEGQRLMVLLNQTPDDRTIRPAMELISINGQPVGDLVSQFWPVNYADGDIETAKRHDIAQDFAKDYWWLVGHPENFTIVARDTASGRTVTARLAGVTEAHRLVNHNSVNDAMQAGLAKVRGASYEKRSLRFLQDSDIAEIRIPLFIGDDFPQWIENTFRTIREKGAKSLIIDLRNNGGGEDSYGIMLVSYLTDKPFHYVDRATVRTITWSFQDHWDAKPLSPEQLAHIREGLVPNPAGGYFVTEKLQDSLGLKQPAQTPFHGKVFILIDGGTFSTAADFCAVAHHLKLATFIGQETAGAYCGNNSATEPTVTLPNSNVRFGLPLCSSWNAVGDESNRHGTIPDYPAETKTADLLRGIDTQLELATAHLP
ncbi:MAG TPA: S41 family peptidase [Tepidisphaeraceae bacterium]|nr:S41 family peptidase [Tepidisphaeraceae bacterium]